MRVLMVMRPAVGGMKAQMLSLAQGLRECGHDVEVAGPGTSDVLTDAAALGFPTHSVPLVGPLHPLHDPRAISALARVVRQGHFDIVHAHGFKAGLVGRLGARAGRCRGTIVTAHNHVMYRDDISGFTKWRYRAVERMLIPFTSRIIAVSDSLHRELVEDYRLPADLVVTVHNGVDVSAFLVAQDRAAARAAFGLPAVGPIFGTACRFAPQKGLRHLIEAFPEVIRRIPDATLVIGGDGPLEAELRQLAAESGVSSRIVWPGHITDMPLFLAGLDLWVSPSLSEGLPLTLIEVAAADVPIVATRAGGTPEVVEDGTSGLLVQPADALALADACVRSLLDPTTAAGYARVARERAIAEFAPAAMISKTLRVYDDVLKPVG